MPYQDLAATPILNELRNCAARQFALAGRMPCRFPITFHSSIPAMDACDCDCSLNGGMHQSGHGQAWVRLVEVAPAKVASNVAGSVCADGVYDLTVEAGVYRCWPVPELGPLEEDEEESWARGMLLDAAALRKALQCCPGFTAESWELIKEEPIGPQGGCIGVSIQAKFVRWDCECPDEQAVPA